MEYYSVMRKDILPFATTRMNLEGGMLSGMSQSEKDQCRTIYTKRWRRFAHGQRLGHTDKPNETRFLRNVRFIILESTGSGRLPRTRQNGQGPCLWLGTSAMCPFCACPLQSQVLRHRALS